MTAPTNQFKDADGLDTYYDPADSYQPHTATVAFPDDTTKIQTVLADSEHDACSQIYYLYRHTKLYENGGSITVTCGKETVQFNVNRYQE